MIKEVTWKEHLQKKMKRAEQRHQKIIHKPHRTRKFLPWWKIGLSKPKIYFYSSRKKVVKQITHRKERTLERQLLSQYQPEEELVFPNTKKMIDFWWLVL
ncbi:hypothetical protein [Caldicellulosiruptor hydrothermalis]|uniref:hypothetical protein n=1 Tax=Caldicellulosiruptor hydrothermalis TaxID=413888 RepID=UPI0005A2D7F6|nr:hypothetical protein [Caldicellulosiruptor hydrothermalis]